MAVRMDFLEGLNPRQREAVEHVEGPLLVLAGAGSGKTRVITHRIAHLMATSRVPGWAILAVTFTNKASGEMRERVRSLVAKASIGAVADPESLPTVSTFHSFCVRLLRRDGAALAQIRPGFTTLFTIYDDDDQVAILKSVYKALGLDDKFMAHRAALSRISHAKSHKTSPEEMLRSATDPTATRLATVYERYQARLREANALDFDDLLLESVRLLQHDTQTREKLNRRYEFVMVDEYQDTNRSQYELMRLLTEQRQNIAVVGDEDQSIYGWRGANIRNILDFERDFPGAVTIRLEQNYRSTQTILEGANAVVAHNTERIGKNLWTQEGSGEKITLYEAPDSENEALWIADTIENRLIRNANERIAVLYRTNSQSRQIEEALRRYQRKYVVVGGFSFYQRAEVKDVLSYLKVLTTPSDSISLLRIINTPARGIGRTTLEQIEQYALANEMSLWSAIERMLQDHALAGRAEIAIAAFHRMMTEIGSQLHERPINETLADLLERTGYRKMLEEEGTEEARTRMGNLDELLNAAADAAERGEALRDFLDHAALVADADSADERAPISLLTMHNAKGLEFPVVFIAGLEEGLFPHSRSLDSETAMEEERRLCYVGMTRAEKKLHLSWARYRRRYGGGVPEPSIASRFLKEVPGNLVDNVRGDKGHVDLRAESWEVRDAARRNLYTGKTYNSVDNIRQFFAERGMPAPQGLGQGSFGKGGSAPQGQGRSQTGQTGQGQTGFRPGQSRPQDTPPRFAPPTITPEAAAAAAARPPLAGNPLAKRESADREPVERPAAPKPTPVTPAASASGFSANPPFTPNVARPQPPVSLGSLRPGAILASPAGSPANKPVAKPAGKPEVSRPVAQSLFGEEHFGPPPVASTPAPLNPPRTSIPMSGAPRANTQGKNTFQSSPSTPPARPAFSPPSASHPPGYYAPPAKKASGRKVGPGSTIEHSKYGRGTVLRLEGSGEDAKLTVSFPGFGLKKLIAKYAGIKVD
jgi:DNA helicase-2/ATP-dependent DNA helicase PcrA